MCFGETSLDKLRVKGGEQHKCAKEQCTFAPACFVLLPRVLRLTDTCLRHCARTFCIWHFALVVTLSLVCARSLLFVSYSPVRKRRPLPCYRTFCPWWLSAFRSSTSTLRWYTSFAAVDARTRHCARDSSRYTPRYASRTVL